MFNNPKAVEIANNKLSFLANTSEYSILEYSGEHEEATDWADKNIPIVLHTDATIRHGKGTVFIDSPLSMKAYQGHNFSFATKFLPRKDEFRICIVDGSVVQTYIRKKSKQMFSLGNSFIRSSAHGFVWEPYEKNVPKQVIDVAINSLDACNLAFGVFDVIWNDFREIATVTDAHTCEELVGTMGTKYKEGFDNIIKPSKPKTSGYNTWIDNYNVADVLIKNSKIVVNPIKAAEIDWAELIEEDEEID